MNQTFKNVLTAVKIGVGALSVGSTGKDFSTMVKDNRFYGIMSGGIDGFSTSNSLYNLSH
jgi:hypothetical protein